MSVEKFLKEACDEQGIIRSNAVDVIQQMTEDELDQFWMDMRAGQALLNGRGDFDRPGREDAATSFEKDIENIGNMYECVKDVLCMVDRRFVVPSRENEARKALADLRDNACVKARKLFGLPA